MASSRARLLAAALSLAVPLIAGFEALRTSAYKDGGGVWTVCYGKTGKGVVRGVTYTPEQCRLFLDEESALFADEVLSAIDVPVTPEQLSALTSFAYNVGLEAFRTSTLLSKLNAKDYYGAANQFPRWSYDNGKLVPGLRIRRMKEKALFEKGTQ